MKLNYFQRLNAFINAYSCGGLTPYDFVLMSYLLKRANKYGDKLTIPNTILEEITLISKNGLLTSRANLEREGWIRVLSGKDKRKAPTYEIIEKRFLTTPSEGVDREQIGSRQGVDREQIGSIYNIDNNIDNNRDIDIEKEYKEKENDSITDNVTDMEELQIESEIETSPIDKKEEEEKSSAQKEEEERISEFADEFRRMQKWAEREVPSILKMQRPFTLEEYARVRRKYEKELVIEVLRAMGNCPNLTKKYVSASLTAQNWLRRREKEKSSNNYGKGDYNPDQTIGEAKYYHPSTL